MALLLSLTHDLTPAPDYSEYDSSPTTTNIYISSAAAMGGTSYGLVVDTGAALGELNSTTPITYAVSGGDTMRFATYFNKNTMSLSIDGISHDFLYLVDVAGITLAAIGLERISGVTYLRAYGVDSTRYLYYSLDGVTGDHTVEVRIVVASSSGASDGEVHLFVDGVSVDSDTAVSNYTHMVANGLGRLGVYDTGASPYYSGSLYFDGIQLRNDNTPIYPPPTVSEEKTLSLSTPLIGGDTIWRTYWDGSSLFAERIIASTGVADVTEDMGTCSSAELESSRAAYVFSISDSVAIVYGYFEHPTLGAAQIIATTDGGSNWSVIQSSWGTDQCGALVATSSQYIYAVRNVAGGSPTLHVGSVGGMIMFDRAELPFANGISHGNLIMDDDENLFAVAATADPVMVVVSPPPYLSWYNITSDHVSVNANRIIRI